MKQSRIQLGSLTLLFSVILICVAVLAVLCLTTAKADSAMAQNYGSHVAELAACEADGQRWLAEVDAALRDKGAAVQAAELPEGSRCENGEISAELSEGSVTLSVRLEILTGSGPRYRILQWSKQTQWSEDTGLKLW